MPANSNNDAELTISPNAGYVELGTSKGVSRAGIILHECIEMVERSENGKSYINAHNSAAQQVKVLDKNDPRYTSNPAVASGICRN